MSSRRQHSKVMSSALAGIKFDDPAANKKKQEEPPDDVDLRDIDKPRNGIIRLPKFVVQGERPPVFSEPEINTKKGMAELAVNRYLSTVHQGLNRYHLPAILGGVSNEDLAMEMYRNDERLKNQKDYNEKLSLFQAAGAKEAEAMKTEARDTYKQTSTFSDPATNKAGATR